jgi:hypothetical protein
VSGTVSVTSSSNVVTSSTGTVEHLGTGGGSFTFDAAVVNTMSIGAVTSSGSNSMSGVNGITVSGTPSMLSTNTSGGGHNIVQRSALVYWNLAL